MRARSLFVAALLLLVGSPGIARNDPGEPPQPEPSAAEFAPGEAGAATEGPADRLIVELREQIKRLDRREREIESRERAVADLETEAVRVLEEAEAIRAASEKRIGEWEEQTGDRVGRLAKVYAEMPANRAAPLLEALELDLTAEILTKMKHKQSAQVLALMSSQAALRLSEKVARPLSSPGPAKPRRPGGTQ